MPSADERASLIELYEVLCFLYAEEGSPKHGAVAAKAGCTVALAKRAWERGFVKELGPAYGPIFSITVTADQEAMTRFAAMSEVDRVAHVTAISRRHLQDTRIVELQFSAGSMSVARANLESAVALNQAAAEVAAHTTTRIHEEMQKASAGQPSLFDNPAQGLALLERVQKVTRGAVDMAKLTMELERLRHTLPKDADDGNRPRESPADAIIYIQEAAKLVAAAAEAQQLTEDDFREYGKLPEAIPTAEPTP